MSDGPDDEGDFMKISEDELLRQIEALPKTRSNVIKFPGTEQTEPNKALRMALNAGLTQVVILGWQDNGDLYIGSSTDIAPDMYWLIEHAKMELIEMTTPEPDFDNPA